MTKHNNRRQAWKEFQKDFGQKLKQMRLEQGLEIDEAVPILIMGATYGKDMRNITELPLQRPVRIRRQKSVQWFRPH